MIIRYLKKKSIFHYYFIFLIRHFLIGKGVRVNSVNPVIFLLSFYGNILFFHILAAVSLLLVLDIFSMIKTTGSY